jgi:hypothetical protein
MSRTVLALACLVLAKAAAGQGASAPAQPDQKSPSPPKDVTFNFDKDDTGKLPDGWKAEGTNQKGPVATWEVTADKTAPSAPNVLSLSKTNHDSGGTFNICWTDKVRFTDGSIEVRFKAVSGKEDQGGGIIWRVKDKDNYMIARMNPLEDNFRVYYVKDASRHQLESAKVAIKAGEWHSMKIEQHADRVRCFLDDKHLLDATDDHVQGEGGVGLWTKADAVSSFDDLSIKPVPAAPLGKEDAKPGNADKKEDQKGKKDKDDDDDDKD